MRWPGATQGNVIWFNAEAGARDTVLPRLVAAGANPKRVHVVTGARVSGETQTFSLVTDLHLLRKTARNVEAARWRAERPEEKAPLIAGLLSHTHFLHAVW